MLYSVTRERYRAWLQLLVDGNQNMIRVWGGGIYEHDAFYDICDGMSIGSACKIIIHHLTRIVRARKYVHCYGEQIDRILIHVSYF